MILDLAEVASFKFLVFINVSRQVLLRGQVLALCQSRLTPFAGDSDLSALSSGRLLQLPARISSMASTTLNQRPLSEHGLLPASSEAASQVSKRAALDVWKCGRIACLERGCAFWLLDSFWTRSDLNHQNCWLEAQCFAPMRTEGDATSIVSARKLIVHAVHPFHVDACGGAQMLLCSFACFQTMWKSPKAVRADDFRHS